MEIHRSACKHGIDDAVILHTLDHAMTDSKAHCTRSGRLLTDEDVDAISAEVGEADYDTEILKKRRRGRPTMGSGPADVVPVRIDPELRIAIEARATADQTTTSEVIREAIRRFLKIA